MVDHLDDVGVNCDKEHDPHDHLIHYTKCLEFYRRKDYLDKCDAEHRVRIDSELRRIKFLRKTLQADGDDHLLVSNVVFSHRVWRKDDIYNDNIEFVREWRSEQGKENKISEPGFADPDRHGEGTKYDPEIDFNAYVISYKNSEPVNSFNNAWIQGSFPNHKINMDELLRKSDGASENPLSAARQGDTINYFHLPANNMQVSSSLGGQILSQYTIRSPANMSHASLMIVGRGQS